MHTNLSTEELLNEMEQMQESSTADTKAHCIIDPETRTINVAPEYKILGVESDEKVERVWFQCPKIVGDNIDLSKLQLRINYQNARNEKDQYIVTDVQIEEDDIVFSWLVSRKATAYMGAVNFIVCAVSADGGVIKNEWNTTLASSEVLTGLEVDSPQIDDNTEDVITQLLQIAQESSTTASEAAETASQAAQEAKEALSNMQELAETVEEKVDSLSKYPEETIGLYYNMQRDGRVYQTRFYKFETNPTSEGTKMLANANLVCEPSTSTEQGQDDYANIPLFQWVHCNYKREADGTPYPIAIEGDENYKTTGDVDVGSMMMSFWYKVEENGDYIDYYISDSPNALLGLKPWVNCVRADGTTVPWNIYSSYFSGLASDGKLRSQPNLRPENFQSYQNMVTNYGKKGDGHFGAGVDLETFQILMIAIKYGTKNSQSVFKGTTNYNVQYQAAVQRSEKDTYFPVTQEQKNNIIVGSSVYVGYPSDNNGQPNYDRGVTTMREYANMAKVLRIEDDGDNAKIYLDCEPFDTMPKTVGTISAQVTISSMHWYSGTTDKVIGHHDGSEVDSDKYPYRVQGIEYAVGGYLLASDTIMDIQADMSKIVYKLNKGAERSSNIETIKANSTVIGTIPAADGSNDYWIGDVGFKDGAWYPKSKGTGNTTGVADRIYFGGTATSGQREYLMGGYLWSGSDAGACCLNCWGGLSLAVWNVLAHD